MENSNLSNDVDKFMKKYEVNLKSALTNLNPSGFISKKQFLDNLNEKMDRIPAYAEAVDLRGRDMMELAT